MKIHVPGEVHLKRTTLSALAESLPEPFLRIHRSRVVNTDKVRALEPASKGSFTVVLGDGTRLRSSRGYGPAIQARFRGGGTAGRAR